MSGRSSRISSLSDKIQGLKFMQRASASSSPSISGSTSTTKQEKEDTTKNTKSTKDKNGNANLSQKNSSLISTVSEQSSSPTQNKKDEEEAGPSNEEHWIVPNAKERIAKQSSSTSLSRIESQTGWNDWLGQLQNGQSSESPSSRRSFGTWAPKSRKSKEEEDDDDRDEDEDDFVESESEEDIQQKGFIKPGSLSDNPKSNKGKGKKRKSDDNHGNSKSKDEFMGDIRKQKKKKTKENNVSPLTESHAKARQESAIKKRKDMASSKKAGKRRKEGFIAPNMNRENDDDQFEVSDNDDTLEGF